MRVAGDWLDALRDAACARAPCARADTGPDRRRLRARRAAGAAGGDIDIATDARPERVIALAEAAGLRAVPTGLDHGTVTWSSDGRPFEVTTLRRDVETDGRHAIVAFTDDVAEDAAAATSR